MRPRLFGRLAARALQCWIISAIEGAKLFFESRPCALSEALMSGAQGAL
jgi:hypothetical protein